MAAVPRRQPRLPVAEGSEVRAGNVVATFLRGILVRYRKP